MAIVSQFGQTGANMGPQQPWSSPPSNTAPSGFGHTNVEIYQPPQQNAPGYSNPYSSGGGQYAPPGGGQVPQQQQWQFPGDQSTGGQMPVQQVAAPGGGQMPTNQQHSGPWGHNPWGGGGIHWGEPNRGGGMLGGMQNGGGMLGGMGHMSNWPGMGGGAQNLGGPNAAPAPQGWTAPSGDYRQLAPQMFNMPGQGA